MTYQIYLKDEPVLIEPNSYFTDIQDAHARRIEIETEQPELDVKLEVRPIPQSKSIKCHKAKQKRKIA